MYKKLKKEADELSRIRAVIKCKKSEVVFLTEEWLWLEGQDLEQDAEQTYMRKYKLELEVQNLESQEKAILKRVQAYVAP